MSIVEFLKARITEDEAVLAATPNAAQQSDDFDYGGTDDYLRFTMGYGRALVECKAKRAIIKQHEDWPVLVEQEPEFGLLNVTDGSYFAYSMSRKIAWLTEREYVYRFGSEPPTAPMIRTLAAVYSDHPDYQEDWA